MNILNCGLLGVSVWALACNEVHTPPGKTKSEPPKDVTVVVTGAGEGSLTLLGGRVGATVKEGQNGTDQLQLVLESSSDADSLTINLQELPAVRASGLSSLDGTHVLTRGPNGTSGPNELILRFQGNEYVSQTGTVTLSRDNDELSGTVTAKLGRLDRSTGEMSITATVKGKVAVSCYTQNTTDPNQVRAVPEGDQGSAVWYQASVSSPFCQAYSVGMK